MAPELEAANRAFVTKMREIVAAAPSTREAQCAAMVQQRLKQADSAHHKAMLVALLLALSGGIASMLAGFFPKKTVQRIAGITGLVVAGLTVLPKWIGDPAASFERYRLASQHHDAAMKVSYQLPYLGKDFRKICQGYVDARLVDCMSEFPGPVPPFPQPKNGAAGIEAFRGLDVDAYTVSNP